MKERADSLKTVVETRQPPLIIAGQLGACSLQIYPSEESAPTIEAATHICKKSTGGVVIRCLDFKWCFDNSACKRES